MVQKNYNVLIIDDHPLIVEAYRSALVEISLKNPECNFTIEATGEITTAISIIKGIDEIKEGSTVCNLIFLDINLPVDSHKKILSGEDLGLYIKKKLPNVKIIVSTMLNDNFRLLNIFKSLDPDGFLIKSDINSKELINGIESTLFKPPYYSKTALNLIRKKMTSDTTIDDLDRSVLYYLSLGWKNKELPQVLPLSIAGIEKRKRRLKELLNVIGNSDSELIRIAKQKGFI